MASLFSLKLVTFNIILIFIAIKDINCINNEALKSLDGKIDENTIEKEINKIIQDYTDFNERYNELVKREQKDKENDDYDKQKYKAEYKKFFEESEIFHEYFFRQRKRLSEFINKPTGKIPEQINNAHDSIVEYVLESKNLAQELGERTFLDKEDL